MIFMDYFFDLVGENILMDPELKPEQIKVKHGDCFIVHINNGRVVLIKVKEENKDG